MMCTKFNNRYRTFRSLDMQRERTGNLWLQAKSKKGSFVGLLTKPQIFVDPVSVFEIAAQSEKQGIAMYCRVNNVHENFNRQRLWVQMYCKSQRKN